MGWVSYLEDVRDRLTDNFSDVQRKIAESGESIDLRDEQRALQKSCDVLIRDIRDHLELATDPEVDLAHEVIALRERDEHQRATITRLQQEKADLTHKLQLFDKQAEELAQCRTELDAAFKETLRTRFSLRGPSK